MPARPRSPGSVVDEVPSGVRAIAGVPTSVTAFVGRARRGMAERPAAVTGFSDFARGFGGLWHESTLGFAVRDFFANGGSSAVVVRLFGGDDTARASITWDTITLRAVSPGAWANELRIRVDHDTRDPDPALGEAPNTLFNLSVLDGTTGAVEEHRDVTIGIADHPRYLRTVLENESDVVRLDVPTIGNTDDRPAEHSHVVPADAAVWGQDSTSTGVAPAESADDGAPLTERDFIGPGKEGASQGLYALEATDLFNLLVIPPYLDSGDVDATVVTAAHAYCTRRRAMLIVDAPAGWDAADQVARADIPATVGTIGRNAALYFPRLRQPNPLHGNRVETFAAAGAVAGVFARTDATRGVWKAPAGLDATLLGVAELSVSLSAAESGLLNPLGVNCLRMMPAAGPVVWGSRTGEGADGVASEWKYVPVRRTALFIEESLHRGLQWAVVEPNNERLWAQIRQIVGAFMHTLFSRGAFQGRTPREAYLVKCDSETTTQADIDRGIVTIVVGFAPLKPAEFVVITIQQLAGQVAP